MKNRFILASHKPTDEKLHYCLRGKLKKIEFVDGINMLSICAKMKNGDDIVLSLSVEDVAKAKELLEAIEEYKAADKPYELTYFRFMQCGYGISVGDILTDEEKLHTPFTLLPVKAFYFISDNTYFDPENKEMLVDEIAKSSKEFAREMVKFYTSIREDAGFDDKHAFKHVLYVSNSVCVKNTKIPASKITKLTNMIIKPRIVRRLKYLCDEAEYEFSRYWHSSRKSDTVAGVPVVVHVSSMLPDGNTYGETAIDILTDYGTGIRHTMSPVTDEALSKVADDILKVEPWDIEQLNKPVEKEPIHTVEYFDLNK